MNVQHERIEKLCEQLRLGSVAAKYGTLADQAAHAEQGYTDFLLSVLEEEYQARQVRTRATLSRMAGFPSIKTLDEYDFNFAVGAPKKLLQDLASLSFIQRKENVILLGPSDLAT